jgi:hypothetical protein
MDLWRWAELSCKYRNFSRMRVYDEGSALAGRGSLEGWVRKRVYTASSGSGRHG